MQPEPLTTAQIRQRQHEIRVLMVDHQMHPIARAHAYDRVAFLEHEIMRCAVEYSDACKQWIAFSSHQGRLFPLALAETFAAVDMTATLKLDCTEDMVVISVWRGIEHLTDFQVAKSEILRVNHEDFSQAFNALETARLLAEQFRQQGYAR